LFFEIVKRVKGDDKLVTFALLLIDGLLEENRSRIEFLVGIQGSKNKSRQQDLVGLLNSFLITHGTEHRIQRDLAAHILA
jgi:hypothetical protein